MTEPRLGMTKSNRKYNHFGRLAFIAKIEHSQIPWTLHSPSPHKSVCHETSDGLSSALGAQVASHLSPASQSDARRSMTPARWIRVRCRTDPGPYCPKASSVLKSPGPTSLLFFHGRRLLWASPPGPGDPRYAELLQFPPLPRGALLKHRRAGRQLPAGRGSRAFTSGTGVWVCGSGLPAHYRYRRCWLLRVQGEHRSQAFWWEDFLFPFPTRCFQYTLRWIAVYFNDAW